MNSEPDDDMSLPHEGVLFVDDVYHPFLEHCYAGQNQGDHVSAICLKSYYFKLLAFIIYLHMSFRYQPYI